MLLCSCVSEESLRWTIDAPASLRDNVVLVTAQVRSGGCDGDALFTDTARPDEGMPSPNALPPGRYGFAVAVTNNACQVFARGCVERDLPASAVTTVLSDVTPEALCEAESCDMGACVGAVDAQIESGAPDAAREAGMRDAHLPDGALPKVPSCAEGADEWTTMLFGFEDLPGFSSADNTGSFTATYFKGVSTTSAADAPSVAGCGKGLFGNEKWGEVSHDPAFSRKQASLDLLYKTPTSFIPTRMMAILSKDATGFGTSHLNLGINPDGRVMLRMSRTDFEFYRCSAPIENETWVHIGINFGEPDLELWVNGQLAHESGSHGYLDNSNPRPCETGVRVMGLDGNTEPWAIGASANPSTAGTNDMVVFEHDLGAVIDQVRFSSTRRDFSDPPLP